MKTPNDLQLYLLGGKTPADLKSELGINYYEHPTLPLIGFKYDQIDSPTYHPIVQQSRGTVLERDTWSLVAQPFLRFYNLGQGADQSFDWSDFTCVEKLDGSLAILYYYANEWHMNTSGSFALQQMNPLIDKTWREVFFEIFGTNTGNLDKHITYIFELTSRYNKIVRDYPVPKTSLIGATDLAYVEGTRDIPESNLDEIAVTHGWNRPDVYRFTSMAEVEAFLLSKEESDRTFEGVIVRDKNNVRKKIKTKTYLALHRMNNNGNPNPADIVNLILTGEADELIAIFPELTDRINQLCVQLDQEFENLRTVWDKTKSIENQKEFAIAIMAETKFSGILFALRKAGLTDLRKAWRDSTDSIVKKLNL